MASSETSDNEHPSSSRPRQLCRYIPNNVNSSSSWIMSPGTNDSGPYTIPLAQFEDIMESSLDDSTQPLHYIDRDDFVWLNCRRPLYPIESVLGLEEETELPSSLASISISTYSLLENQTNERPDSNDAILSYNCYCPPSAISPMVYNRSSNKVAGSSDGGITNREFEEGESAIVMEWLDCRSLKSDFDFSSAASCVHFLRCLLDARHDSSPWVTEAQENEDCSPGSSSTRHTNDKDIVILLVARQAIPEKLIQFRVSDACPSWFLHAVGHVRNVNSTTMPWLNDEACLQTNDENCSTKANGCIDSTIASVATQITNDEAAAVIIYRRLPPRAGLSAKHPLSQQPVQMVGCLWETFYVVKEDLTAPDVKYRKVGPPIVDPLEEYPDLFEALIRDSIDAMRQEALQIAHWTAWPEQQHYKATSETGEAPWNVFPLCHTFPAHDLTKRQWVTATCAAVPQTVAALRVHLGDTLRTALFSRLDPESVLEAHTGWEDLANHVLRVHIPLVLPPMGGDLCGVWVDGCVQLHRPGQALCFDDSKIHRAFNYSTQARIVLILDLVRPTRLPLGTATGGHSDELDEFIGKMGVAR